MAKVEATLISGREAELLSSLAAELSSLRQAKAALEERVEQVVKELDTLVVSDGLKLSALGWVVSRVGSVNRRISADKLLERGVDPGVIEYATVETSFHKYYIKAEKGEGEKA